MSNSEMQVNQRSKKPYVKPQIVYKQPLEAMAASCTTPGAKASTGAPGFCTAGQLFS